MKIPTKAKGFSVYLSWGDNKKFQLLERDGPSFRIKLWKLSICMVFADIEGVMKCLLDELDAKDNLHQVLIKREEKLSQYEIAFEAKSEQVNYSCLKAEASKLLKQ